MEIPEGLEDEEGPEPNADDANDANDPNVCVSAAALRSLDTSVELAMVTDGIKYAAVGIDDPDAVLTWDEVTGELSVELSDAPWAAISSRKLADDAQPRRPRRTTPTNVAGTDSWIEAGERLPEPRPAPADPAASRFASEFASRSACAAGGPAHRPPTASLVRANSLGAALAGARARGVRDRARRRRPSLVRARRREPERLQPSRNRRQLGARAASAEHRVSTEFAGTAGDGAVGGSDRGRGVRRRVGVGGVRRRAREILSLFLAQK